MAEGQARRRILGIDPGTIHVGYGIIEIHPNGERYVASGSIHARQENVAKRLVDIHAGLRAVIRQYQPSVAAIESVFIGNNIKTAIAIGEGRGVAMLSAAEAGLEVLGYEPATIKKCVAGSGRAGKEQIQRMVTVLLSLPETPATDHEADALAIAITHHRRERMTAVEPPALAMIRGVGGNRKRRRARR